MTDIGAEGREKIALVTGGGTGIGRAITVSLARAGYVVVICGRRATVLDEAAAAIAAETGGRIVPIVADVADPVSVASLFSAIEAGWGRLDLLVNNAGIFSRPVPMEDLGFEEWNAVVAANLTGVFLCSQHAIRMMKAQEPKGGRIINNGSISAHTPRPYSLPYTATKHAVTGITKSIALDYRSHGIACGQIDVGNAATAMTERMGAGVLQANGEVMPEARMSADHVGEAVVYMAGLPLSANVLFMTVMATEMPYVGRG